MGLPVTTLLPTPNPPRRFNGRSAFSPRHLRAIAARRAANLDGGADVSGTSVEIDDIVVPNINMRTSKRKDSISVKNLRN
jgi:hypothetical protein